MAPTDKDVAAAAKDGPEVLARVRQGLDLVDLVARHLVQHVGRCVAFDELRSFGSEGLLSAARSFDPDRGVPFRRWAAIRVRGAMIDGVRSLSSIPRSVYRRMKVLEAADRVQEARVEEDAASPATTAEQADERLGSYMAGIATAVAMGLLGQRVEGSEGEATERGLSAEEQMQREELFAAVRAAIESRPDPEKQLLQRHYFDDVTFEQAAVELGLSKSWASRLHARAIEAIGRELKRAKIGK
jgi:RNA polymerase sigma factor for flagellar operon FliA